MFQRINPWVYPIVAFIALLLFLFLWPFVQIGTGERGVVLHFGAYNGEVLDQGLKWRTPILTDVVKINVQVQAAQAEASAASKDLNNVTAQLTVNFHVDHDRVGELYQNIGLNYADKVIFPAIQEAVKATTAKYTAEELVTKREAVKQDALVVLRERLQKSYIVVDDLSITNFEFSQSFNQAIEAKVTAEQDALAAKNKLEQVKFEAQQKIETAKADAESIKIQAQALAQNQELVKLKAVEKWDGKLPQYMTGVAPVPFVDVSPTR